MAKFVNTKSQMHDDEWYDLLSGFDCSNVGSGVWFFQVGHNKVVKVVMRKELSALILKARQMALESGKKKLN